MKDIPKRNIDRAKRIPPLIAKYQELLGEAPDEECDPIYLSAVMADMRHYCDMVEVDFNQQLELSALHYDSEQGEFGE